MTLLYSSDPDAALRHNYLHVCLPPKTANSLRPGTWSCLLIISHSAYHIEYRPYELLDIKTGHLKEVIESTLNKGFQNCAETVYDNLSSKCPPA